MVRKFYNIFTHTSSFPSMAWHWYWYWRGKSVFPCRTLILHFGRNREALHHKSLCMSAPTTYMVDLHSRYKAPIFLSPSSEFRLEKWWALLKNVASWTNKSQISGAKQQQQQKKHSIECFRSRRKHWRELLWEIRKLKRTLCAWSI